MALLRELTFGLHYYKINHDFWLKRAVLTIKEDIILKRYIAILITAIVLSLALVSIGGPALADDVVKFSITPDPAELSKGASVKFVYKVINDTGTEYSDCAIFYDLSLEPMAELGNLKDMAKEGSFKMKVEDNMLDVPLTFHVKSGNGSVLATIKVTVRRKIDVKLSATIKPNRTMAAKGDSIKLSVKLENQGNVDVTSVKVSAAGLNSGKPFKEPATLIPGEAWNFDYSFNMPDADITFTPTISYSANGESKTINFEPVTIVLESPGVLLSVEPDKRTPNPGEEVTFVVTITNNGNISYTNMSISVNGENEKFPSKRLKPGDTYSATYKRSFEVSTEVTFTFTLTNHMGEIKNVSSTVSIRLPVETEVVNENLSLSITADRQQLASAGVVNFSGYVQNFSEYTLSDVRVDEEHIGNIFATSQLNPGERQQIQWSQNIDETTEYNFVLTATDIDGNIYNKSAEPITVTILLPAEPTPDFDDAVTLPPLSDGIGTTGVLLIVAGVLVLLIIGVGVTLIVLWQKGRSNVRTPRKPAAKKRLSPRTPVRKSYRDRNNF